jgi:hypothetical protein
MANCLAVAALYQQVNFRRKGRCLSVWTVIVSVQAAVISSTSYLNSILHTHPFKSEQQQKHFIV